MANILHKHNAASGQELTRCLRLNRIAIAPCDTIYGILGLVPESEEKIRSLKGNSGSKRFIVLQPSTDLAVAAAMVEIPGSLLDLWPGPLTLVVATSGGTTGFRVPADPFLRNVLEKTGSIYSTSVNLAGQSPLWKIADIVDQFGSRVDLIIDGGDLEGRTASTVLDISTRPYHLLRAGAIELPEDIKAKCGV